YQWQAFLDDHLRRFGPVQDAITQRSAFVHHSVISPALNLGLVTPRELLDSLLEHASEHDVPLNSLEGLVRQLIGWREFIRGVDRLHGAAQAEKNFWDHQRRMSEHWDSGDTGIPLLDQAIRRANRHGWTHHIERLMVLGNLMTLCEIEPREAYRWFMERFVDSSDWVMGPNVYGMGLFSDGGLFATKPYICGSNYLLKMSDAKKGDWCDAVDGLYWRFIGKHRDFFESNPRLAMMPRTLDRMNDERLERITEAAEAFLDRCTITS
ncbi:MAG: FAD-binding domain-containing protein, partial [Xanthomonadales bacterium]|nr:FAD-binding domain-containing protein [Xanthomonadales bacterium]